MKADYVFNLEILFFVFLVLTRALLGEQCNSNGINCISCTSYQKCDGGNPVGPVLRGNECDQEKLEQCHVKYNCYGLNECTQAGVFPDAEDESNYYVCLNDPTAFVKYEFRCVEEEFFDKSTLMCIPKAATLSGSDISSSLEDVTGETDSSSEASSTSSTESSSEGSSTSSTESSSEGSSTSSTESSSEGPSTSPTESSSEGPSTSSTESSSEGPSTSPTESSSEGPSTSSTESSSEGPSTSPTESSSEGPSTSSTESSSEGPSTSPTESSSEGPSTSSTESSSEGPSTSPTESSSTTSTSSTEITTSTPPGTISTTASPFVCKAPGIFPSSSNCKIYHRCSTSLRIFNYVCPGTSYFNENILKCSMIITPACQAQISQNSSSTVTTPVTTQPTTTSSSTTTTSTTTISTTTTTTTTTTPSTTTTTTTTTALPTTPKSFSCPTSGIFSNPNSCKTYYRCSTSGMSFVYTCPGETYFNEFTNKCSLQITPRCQMLLQS